VTFSFTFCLFFFCPLHFLKSPRRSGRLRGLNGNNWAMRG
jgi:hypothetical protein